MSGGKDAARDTRHGRRGGGWMPAGRALVRIADMPRCKVCDRPMTVGQKIGHAVCVGGTVAFGPAGASIVPPS